MNITQASKAYDMPSDTIRYYERIGLVPPITRNKNGHRDFKEQDLNWVYFAKQLRGAGVSVETLCEYVSLFQQGKETMPTRKALLVEEREKIAHKIEEMQSVLNRLDHKINRYEEHLLPYEENKLRE